VADNEEESSSIAGLVLVGALIAFAVLMFLANFSGQMAKPTDAPPAGVDAARVKAKGKAKGKMKVKGKGPKAPPIPPEDLLVEKPLPDKPDPPADAPNVVFVVLTAARRDQLTPYGASEGVTPFLGRMAAGGVRFDDVISESPYSRASGAALFTGRHSWLLDMVEPGPRVSQKILPAEVDTLAEVVQRSGWDTYGITGNFNMNVDVGITQGFDVFRNAQRNGFAPGRRLEAQQMKGPVDEWLSNRSSDRPFFLYMGIIDLHSPVRSVDTETENFDPDTPGAPYRAAAHRVDGVLEELWARLDKDGLAENTLLVVTADHGEGLGIPEHHGTLHGRLLYDSSVVVPWILSGPGVAEGHSVDGITAQVDVMPTLLDLLGLPLPDNLDGRSWAPQVRGESDQTERQRAYSATWHFGAHRGSVWTSDRQCQLDFGSVGFDDGFVDACYDRTVDPTFTNVITERRLTDELDAWHNDIMKLVTSAPPPKGKAKGKAKEPSKAKGKSKGKAKGKGKTKGATP